MSTAAARCASSARRSWYGVHCRIAARPSAAASANRRQVSNPQARQSHGRPLGPSPICSRIAAHRLGVRRRIRRGLNAKRRAHARHHRPRPPPAAGSAAPRRSPAARAASTAPPAGPTAGGPATPSVERMSTKPRSSRSTATARATAGSASSPRIFRNRRLECRASSSSASGSPPAALRCRRRSSGTRWNQRRLRQHAHPADAEELVQIAERDGRVEIGAADRRADARVRDPEPVPVLRPQISGLGHRRRPSPAPGRAAARGTAPAPSPPPPGRWSG